MFSRLNACRNREEGFTLIEIIVVLFLIGILGGIAFGLFRVQADRSRNAAITASLNQTAKLLENYYVLYQKYPPPNADLTTRDYGNYQKTDGVVVEVHVFQDPDGPDYRSYCIVATHVDTNRNYWHDSEAGMFLESSPTPPDGSKRCDGVQGISNNGNLVPGIYVTEGPATAL